MIGARAAGVMSTRSSLAAPVVADRHRRERLRKLGAVAIERIGLEAKLPGQLVSLAAVLDRCGVGHVDRFGDRARDERLCCSHHAYVTLRRQAARAISSTGICTIEHGEMLALEIGCALDRHRSAGEDVRGARCRCVRSRVAPAGRAVDRRARRRRAPGPRGRSRRPACSARRRSGCRRPSPAPSRPARASPRRSRGPPASRG